MKLFYTGPLVNGEMLVVMLEKHGIAARQEFLPTNPGDPAVASLESDPGAETDLSRPVQVFVPEQDYDRAYQLFYAEREDEL